MFPNEYNIDKLKQIDFGMSVHYKFKSSLDFDTITFDGLHISVNDFRKAVIQQKRIGKANDFELQIINAQTKEVYENDNDLIPKNTSLIISRIPQTSKKTKDLLNQSTISACHVPKFDGNTLDLSQMNASEEDKIQAMMAQSTVDYDPRGYQKIRGPGQSGDVPPNYRCYKCHQTGHWIKNCPLPHSSSKKSEMRRNTGIPKSFLQEKATEKESAADNTLIVEKKTDVPDELVCSICQDIFRDAVMIPCCGSSFCDDCVRSALLDSEENECPDCKEKGTSPGSLIPNRFLRSSVNTFKNETGYERKKKSNGISGMMCNLAMNSSEKTSNKSNEKQAELDSVEKSHATESTKEKAIPERKDDVLENKNVETITQEDKEEYQGERKIETNSPKKQLEVVTAQPEISHNSEVQTRSEESFKTVNPSSFSNYGSSVSELSHRLSTADTYSGRPDSFMRHTKQNHMPHMSYCSNFNSRSERYYYPRDSYNINPAPYLFLPNTRCRQMTPQANIQPYYQGLSGTMETGIIEDPLEAFNRIMKEKERRKEMKRLATDRHRSVIAKRSSRDTSPMIEKRNRHRTSPCSERRNRSPLRQEKQSHRNIERDKTVRNHRSHYSNIKRSFSRSNSPPQRRYSKSPRKRSRSRSHARSHSRDIDLPRHENRSSKYIAQQHHRAEYDRDVSRYKKKSSSHYSEARALSESGPNRKNSSKMGENGVQIFENFETSGHRKKIPESINIKESRDLQYELHGRASKVPFYKSEDIQKVSKREEEGKNSVQVDEMSRQEMGKKNRERKRKKEKDEKLEKKSKKEKKEKKKQRHKEEQKKYLEHGRAKRDCSTTLTVHIKNTPENENQSRVSRIDNCKGYNVELLGEGNETFTPDINSSRSLEIEENDDRLIKKNDVLKVNKTAKLSTDFRYKEPEDNNCSELNTPTSFIDTTPENYVGKWDNFDLLIPNSGDMRIENDHNCEYDVDDQGCSPSMRNETTKNYSKKDDTISRVDEFEYRKPKIEDIAKEARSEISEKSSTRKSSPTLSEAISSSSNSNVDKTSQTKKRRKKGKHKKEKRSSSTESSKMLRKSANKHKKSRSEKRKKIRRYEFQ